MDKKFSWKYLIPFYGIYVVYRDNNPKKWLYIALNIFLVLVIIGAVSGDEQNIKTSDTVDSKTEVKKKIKIGKPDQIQFHQKLKIFKEKYSDASNDLKKSAVYREMVSYMRNYLKGGRVVNWQGKLTSIGTTEGGKKTFITIESEFNDKEISYSTVNNELSDMFVKSMINLGSSVYKDLTKLSEGDEVVFSAYFIKDSKRGFSEQSITEGGFVEDPNFTLRFISIKKK